jgi:hypothetical protein
MMELVSGTYLIISVAAIAFVAAIVITMWRK